MQHDLLNDPLLQNEVQQYIRENLNIDTKQLILNSRVFPNIANNRLAIQINGFRLAKSKIPEWTKIDGIIYPERVSIEQCSSSITAKFKAKLVEGSSALDLTGGFGVDAHFLSQNFDNVYYVEKERKLANIAEHNFKLLQDKNVFVSNNSAEEIIHRITRRYDLIYLDPSRRDVVGKRVFNFQSCEPDITLLVDQLGEISEQVLIKAAPFLDIKKTIKDLGGVEKIWVVSVRNECKELLFLKGKDSWDPFIETINLLPDGSEEKFHFKYSEEMNWIPSFGDFGYYIYEPNASILKAGAFKIIAKEFNLKKIAQDSHFYTSDKLHQYFPGRIFEIIKEINAKKLTDIKEKVNVICRNYHLSSNEVVNKFKIKSGGEKYVLLTRDTSATGRIMLCTRFR